MSVDIMATKNTAARRLDVIALAPATPIGEATATISACASNQPSASREARQASQNDDTIPPPGEAHEAQANAEVGKQVSKSPIIIIYHCPSRVQCRGRRPSEEFTIS